MTEREKALQLIEDFKEIIGPKKCYLVALNTANEIYAHIKAYATAERPERLEFWIGVRSIIITEKNNYELNNPQH